ncbi:unnamed protein product [Penicillium bialowiezense]
MNLNRMAPPESPLAPPGPHPAYEPAWRPPGAYPPPFDTHPDSRRSSANSQTPLPPHPYPVLPDRQLPQLNPDGAYGRPPNGLPPNALSPNAPVHSPQDSNPPHPNFRPPMNGAHDGSPEYRARMSYAPPDGINGDHTPSSGPLPPASQFMTPVPQMATSTPPGYDPSFYQNPAYGRQRKAARATQACDQCRTRKAKCDEGRPNCSHCKENNLTCVYKEVPPHKQEKTTQVLLDRMAQMEERLEAKMGEFSEAQRDHERLLRSFSTEHKSTPGPVKASLEFPVPAPPLLDQKPVLKQETPLIAPASVVGDPSMPDANSSSFSGSVAAAAAAEEPEGELSIPVEHTTAAHKLLMWPSIKKLLNPKEYDEDYVMRLEEERGLISIYGQGEISYTADDSQLPTDGGFDGARPDGDGAGLDADVDIDKFGNLKLDVGTATRYYECYLGNMYKLHPFLEQGELDQKVDRFIRCYCRLNTSPSSTTNVRPGRDGPPPAKRRRSNEHMGVRGEFLETPISPMRPRVGKNIDNAIVLLVLALGAICEVPAPLPGPIMDSTIDYRTQHIPGPLTPVTPRSPPDQNPVYAPNGVLSPANSEPANSMTHSRPLYAIPMQTASQSFPSTLSTLGENRKNLSRRTVSAVQDEHGNTKNYQVIAGLTMYGYATSIIGYLQGGNELEHVQAGLLAGLYAGQLAHPFQSHSWISQASRACQVLVRSKRYERLADGPVLDLYNFAYWTCLQLESDLLAELDIPASGISRSESRMATPKGKFTINLPDDLTAPPTMMMLFYSAQIHLRKVLNRVHTDLYKVEKQGQQRWSSTVQEVLSMNLDLWRTSLPDGMKWADGGPPSDEINAARMRAKYYGARYIIHRPLLYHALHYGHAGARVGPVGQAADSPNASQSSPSLTQKSTGRSSHMSRMPSDMGSTLPASLAKDWTPPNVILRDLPKKLRLACKICIDSAISSTEAFDGVVGHRLVVTNIFGTAHAQFGNMLVLSATYMSGLRELVSETVLERLLKRTISFLAQSEQISPTLRADARILTEIYEKIFGYPPDMASYNGMKHH